MTLLPLSSEDKKALEKVYFIQWTVYKYMLITIGAVIGVGWLWLGYTSLQDEELRFVFYLITGFVLILVLFGGFALPAYRRKVKVPLETDLLNDQKIRKTGKMLSLESAGKYNSNIVFQENGSTDTELLPYNLKFAEVLVIGRHIIIEYTPAAKLIVHAAFVVPLTEEELIAKKKGDRYVLIAVISVVCILMLIIFWIVTK
jgi:hypothetical protein